MADFGLSRVLGEGPIQTGSLGTVSHMPPETLADGIVSRAVDVWSFG